MLIMLDIVLIIFLIFGFVGLGVIILKKNYDFNTKKKETENLRNNQEVLQNGQWENNNIEQQKQVQPLEKLNFFNPFNQIKDSFNIFKNVQEGNIKEAASSGFDFAIKGSPLGIVNETIKIVPDNSITKPIKNVTNTIVKNLNPISWF